MLSGMLVFSAGGCADLSLIRGNLVLTRMSLKFLALLFPLISFKFNKVLVELDFSNISQLCCTILLHSLKLGWNVVMRKVHSTSP